MIRTEHDELESYLTKLDRQAADYAALARLNAYATGIRRGFLEGLIVGAVAVGIAWLIVRFT